MRFLDYEKPLAALLLLLFAAQGARALQTMSSTADETHYLGMGCYLLGTHHWDLDDAVLHPPLSYYLHSVALSCAHIDPQAFQIRDSNARGRLLMDSAPDDRILHLARWPVLILATLLGFLVLIWGRQACGAQVGLGALFLYAFNPTILGNAVLITPDLCLTFFSTLTFYLVWRYTRRPSWTTLVAISGALGLALLSKYTGILVAVAIVLIAVLQRLRRGRDKGVLGLRHLAAVFLLALLVVDAGYFFSGAFRLLDGVSFRSQLFQSLSHTGLLHWVPSPLPRAYVMGIDWQYTVAENGFGYFMLGKVAQRGWIAYYLLAFLLKSPVALLLFAAIASMAAIRQHEGRMLRLILLVPVMLFFLYFSLTTVSRGLRYLLPIFPLLFVWISMEVVALLGRYGRGLRPREAVGDRLPHESGSRSKAASWAAALLGVWYAGACLWIGPHYLAYFNELCGGPNNGQNLLHESEFDWGQGLKELGEYLAVHGIKHVQLSYFGTADPAHYGIGYDPLPCDPEQAFRKGEPIAVSATALYWDCNRWLLQRKPSDRIGYTIFVYRVPRMP